MNDIVYILRNNIGSNCSELRYSIRSVVENFKGYNRIVFYGGQPDGIVPDKMYYFKQIGEGKWSRTRSMFESIMSNDDLTEDIWLFNDDFFIMNQIDSVPYIFNGTLERQASRIEKKHKKKTSYTKRLVQGAKILRGYGFDTLSYECHVPFLVNRKEAQIVLTNFNDKVPFRSAYGNYLEVGGMMRADVKISNNHKEPNQNLDMLSTSDVSFEKGKVGGYIRKQFTKKTKYEF